tara:strand:+ start:116 stop:286 length:171 start_codon:yes stop_codon:yes gene_type:complete
MQKPQVSMNTNDAKQLLNDIVELQNKVIQLQDKLINTLEQNRTPTTEELDGGSFTS